MTNLQGKYWCWTWNNPTLTDESTEALFKEAGYSYLIFEPEFGESGTFHYQGYVEFPKLKRLSQLKKLQPAIHWERRKGSQQQAIDYCKKDGRSNEWGTPCETNQGARSDLSRGIQLLREGGIRAVATEAPETYVRNHRGLMALDLLTKPPKPAPTVTLAFGPPGCGKSRHFHDNSDPNSRWVNAVDGTGLWFDGYAGERFALLDDFCGRASHYTLANLLRLLDRYELRVPVKGGHVWWIPEHIMLTTNFHPRDWYDWSSREVQFPALQRRIDLVLWWKHPKQPEPIEITPDDPDWDHFWLGAPFAQLALDKQSGKLVSNAPSEYFDW